MFLETQIGVLYFHFNVLGKGILWHTVSWSATSGYSSIILYFSLFTAAY